MIDESAHKVFDYGMKDWHDFRTHKCSHCSRQLDIYYCESRLYLVRCKHCRIVSLVEAGNPNEAAEKVNHCTQQPNEPLTLEKLKQMDGEPVWVKRLSEKQDLNCWGFHDEDGVCGYCANFDDDDYGKTWLAYDHKPKEGEKG